MNNTLLRSMKLLHIDLVFPLYIYNDGLLRKSLPLPDFDCCLVALFFCESCKEQCRKVQQLKVVVTADVENTFRNGLIKDETRRLTWEKERILDRKLNHKLRHIYGRIKNSHENEK